MIFDDGVTEVGQSLSHFAQEIHESVGGFTLQKLSRFNGAMSAPIGHIILQNARLLKITVRSMAANKANFTTVIVAKG